jgi:hypothetical protein
MNRKMLLLLLCCSVIATLGVKIALSRRAPGQAPYTIVWKVTTTDANGNVAQDYMETRYVSANGNWHTIKQYTDGHTEEGFAEVGRGVFAIKPDRQKMYFLSEHDISQLNAEGLQQSRQFARTETILGYTAYVMRQAQDGTALEIYRAPALNGNMIKQVFHNQASTMTFEPISITPGEPPSDKLSHAEYSLDNSVYTQAHGNAAPPQ